MTFKKPVIITHNGNFHADEVFAVATILLAIKEDAEIIRTRDPEVVKTGEYVVDVGGIYDPGKNRFDHHQKEGAGGRSNGISYSSIGLVWKKFGELVSGDRDIAEIIDTELVQPLDAHDNGIDIIKPLIPKIAPFEVGHVMHYIRPTFNESKNIDESFKEAVSTARHILERIIIHKKSEKNATEKIKTYYDTGDDKRILVLHEYLPWEDYVVFNYPEVLFVVYPHADSWRVKSVRKDGTSFESRRALPEKWGGKINEDLQKETGVSDAIFCHNKLFTCAARSKEGILTLVKLALL